MPWVIGAGFGRFQVGIDELLTLHPQSSRQAVFLLLAERRLHVLAAVGAGGAVNSRPHWFGGLEDALVQFLGVQSTVMLQERAEFPVLIVLFLGQHAQLDSSTVTVFLQLSDVASRYSHHGSI